MHGLEEREEIPKAEVKLSQNPIPYVDTFLHLLVIVPLSESCSFIRVVGRLIEQHEWFVELIHQEFVYLTHSVNAHGENNAEQGSVVPQCHRCSIGQAVFANASKSIGG